MEQPKIRIKVDILQLVIIVTSDAYFFIDGDRDLLPRQGRQWHLHFSMGQCPVVLVTIPRGIDSWIAQGALKYCSEGISYSFIYSTGVAKEFIWVNNLRKIISNIFSNHNGSGIILAQLCPTLQPQGL